MMEVFCSGSSVQLFEDIAENVTLDNDSWLENEDISSLLLLEEQPCSDGTSIINEEEFRSLCQPFLEAGCESDANILLQENIQEDNNSGTELLLLEEKEEEEEEVKEFHRDEVTLQFRCPKCPKEFSYQSRLKRHLTTHQSKQFFCEKSGCDKSFSRRDVMEVHLRRVHGLHRQPKKSGEESNNGHGKLQCPQCNAKLTTRHHYQRHLQAHEKNAGNFECDFCGKTFSQRRKYLVHRRQQHVGEKKYKCDVCDKSFLQKEFLLRHQFIHSAVAPFSCDLCGASFRQQVNLKQHQLRRHPQRGLDGGGAVVVGGGRVDDDRPHACLEDGCGKRFRTSSELKNHKLYHGEVARSYSCHFCSSAFVEKRHLDRHIRRVHTGVRNFPCEYCDKTFYEKYELNYHCRRHHAHHHHHHHHPRPLTPSVSKQ